MSFRGVRVLAGWLGALSMVAVLTPQFDALSDRSFAWHMVQHLIVMLVAVPLMLLSVYGAPWQRLLSRPAMAAVARFSQSPIVQMLFSAPVGWIAMIGVLWVAHFSGFYASALEHPYVHVLEHALFAIAAVLFWLPVIGNVARPPITYPARLLYLFLALPQGAFLAAALLAARSPLYAPYAAGLGASRALIDQQDAAAIMWLGGGSAIFVALMIVAAAWAGREYARDAVA